MDNLIQFPNSAPSKVEQAYADGAPLDDNVIQFPKTEPNKVDMVYGMGAPLFKFNVELDDNEMATIVTGLSAFYLDSGDDEILHKLIVDVAAKLLLTPPVGYDGDIPFTEDEAKEMFIFQTEQLAMSSEEGEDDHE